VKIRYQKSFSKDFAKLSPKQKSQVEKRIQEFIQNPFNPILKNHALHGKMITERSISAGGNLRIIFREEDDYIVVIFIHVGSHNKVY
jgi:addiction module RelE/StbE family toxin